jgi:hypothetical protein
MEINPLQRLQKIQNTEPEERLNPYQNLYGLKENPFPSLALFTPSMDDPRRNGTIYDVEFRSDEEKRYFELFVLPPTGDKPKELGFIRLDPQAGGRGNGKSAFLHHLMNRVNERQWNGWTTDLDNLQLSALAVHLLPEPRKQKRFWQFVQLIFETFAEHELFKKVDADFKAAMIIKLLPEAVINKLSALPNEEILNLLYSSEKFIALLSENGISLQGYNEEILRFLKSIAGEDLDQRFVQDFLTSNADLRSLWLTWKKDGIADSAYLWRNHGAGWFLNGLVPVLIIARYNRLHILLDEFEKIYIYQSTKEREEFLDSMRQNFFERNSVAVRREFLSLILTTHPSIDRYLKTVWTRVGLDNLAPLDPSRIASLSIELGASSKQKLSHLLTTYIDYFRLDSQHQGTLYPFAENALDRAMDEARYYPRGSIWYAHAILVKAASESVPAPINSAYVETFIASGQKPATEDEDNLFVLPQSTTDLKAE